MTYKITYSGWTTIEVEAHDEQEAIEKFWDEGLNGLNDAEIDEVTQND